MLDIYLGKEMLYVKFRKKVKIALILIGEVNNMTEAIPQKPAPRRGRIFSEITISPEELARRKAEGEAFSQRC